MSMPLSLGINICSIPVAMLVEGGTIVVGSLLVSKELLVVGGSQDMIPENTLDSGSEAAGRWEAEEGGRPVVVSKGFIQLCEVREEVEGEGGMGGVVICFGWMLPGEKGAGCTAGEVWSASMTTWGEPDELGALPKIQNIFYHIQHPPTFKPASLLHTITLAVCLCR